MTDYITFKQITMITNWYIENIILIAVTRVNLPFCHKNDSSPELLSDRICDRILYDFDLERN